MQEKSNQERFKNHLRKIGSGEHTSRGMTREESADALNLILTGIPSPAQIGAFLIAHRIRRPEPQELAGMIDTYLTLGPQFKSGKHNRRPVCFGMPFDGRTKTAPIYPLTTLVLISAGQPVVLHGGERMPVKFGVTTHELFNSLGLNLKGITMNNLQNGFLQNGFALIYQPDHFPLAQSLIHYREEIGKRPPLASMELLWTAHRGKHLLINGFVHPPTEKRHWKTLELMGENDLMTIKGLEGSTDLPINQECIIGRIQNKETKRIKLHAKSYNYSGKEITFKNLEDWQNQAIKALHNEGPLKNSLVWNSGVYLWIGGITATIEEGISRTKSLIESGAVRSILEQLIFWRQGIK